ncbi:LADA_0E11958g1_1 [Lachancea dasiensis]|uniref:holo-[acyl-carrier-protein] synthase n=1 Tax=Lachancea dasiensis TaxID=1072105 RepID=A0A1G4JEZ6_9SACH|nr:LADA_0E11958g1_1 [Lachancea dasiensis]
MWLAQESSIPCVLICDSRRAILSDDFEFETLLRLFSLETQRKITNKRERKLRNLALCNQLLQLASLSRASGQAWRETKFEFNAYGKPQCAGFPNLSFNMSNSDGRTAIYLDLESDVGLDLASTKDCQNFGEENYLEVFRPIFTEHEFRHLNKLPPGATRDRLFTHYWSLKEAYTKLKGVGLNCNLSEIDLGVIEPCTYKDSAQSIERDIGIDTIYFQSKWLDSDLIVSICKVTGPKQPTMTKVPIVDLELADVVEWIHSTK